MTAMMGFDTQEIEGPNSILRHGVKLCPIIGVDLLAARLTIKKFDLVDSMGAANMVDELLERWTTGIKTDQEAIRFDVVGESDALHASIEIMPMRDAPIHDTQKTDQRPAHARNV